MWETPQHEGQIEDQYLCNMSPGGFDSELVEMNLYAMVVGGLEPKLLSQGALTMSSVPQSDPWVPPPSRGSLSAPTAPHNYGPYRDREASLATASAIDQEYGRSVGSIYSSPDHPNTFQPEDAELGLEDDFGGLVYKEPSNTGSSGGKRRRSATAPEMPQPNDTSVAITPRTAKRPKKGSIKEAKISYVCEEMIFDEDGAERICHKSFDIPSNLKKHLDKHRKPHKCTEPNCNKDKGFTTSSDLDRHKWSLHGIPSAGGSNCYRCPIPKCSETGNGKTFPRKDNFKQHVTRSHAEVNADEVVKLAKIRLNNLPLFSAGTDMDSPHVCHTLLPAKAYFESHTPHQMQHASYISDSQPQGYQYQGYMSGAQSISSASAAMCSRNRMMGPPDSMSCTPSTQERFSPSVPSSYGYSNPSRASSRTSQSIHDEVAGINRQKSLIGISPSATPMIPRHLEPNQTLVRSTRRGGHAACIHRRYISSPSFAATGHEPVELPTGCMPQQMMSGSGPVVTLDGRQQQSQPLRQAHQSSGQHMIIPDNRQPLMASTTGAGPSEHTRSSQYSLKSMATQVAQPAPAQEERARKPGPVYCAVQGCGKRFKAKSVYQKHLIRHQRLFACTFEGCPTTKRFGSKNDWKRHESKQHGGGTKEQWRCESCAICFDTSSTFEAHFRSTTGGFCNKARTTREQCRISLEAGGGFWCGFCARVMPIDGDSLNAEDDRFNHIANHFLPGRSSIEDWHLPNGTCTKQEAEDDANFRGAETDRSEALETASDSAILSDEINASQEYGEDSEASLEDAEGDLEEDDEVMMDYSGEVHVSSQTNFQARNHTTRAEARNESLMPVACGGEVLQLPDQVQAHFNDTFSCCGCGTSYALNGMQIRCLGFGYIGECNHTFCEECPGFVQE